MPSLPFVAFLPWLAYQAQGLSCANDELNQEAATSQACVQSTAHFSGLSASESLLQRGLSSDFVLQQHHVAQPGDSFEIKESVDSSSKRLHSISQNGSLTRDSGQEAFVPEDDDFATAVMQAATLASDTQNLGPQLVWTGDLHHDSPSHQSTASKGMDAVRLAAALAAVQFSAKITALGLTAPLLSSLEGERPQSKIALAAAGKAESKAGGSLVLVVIAFSLVVLMVGAIVVVLTHHERRTLQTLTWNRETWPHLNL